MITYSKNAKLFEQPGIKERTSQRKERETKIQILKRLKISKNLKTCLKKMRMKIKKKDKILQKNIRLNVEFMVKYND
jgi:hypothetical protein